MIIGCDEVNFSPSLAGDCVVVALTRCPGTKKVRGVKDSKQLTNEQRFELFGKLQDRSFYSVVPATVNSINAVGIYVSRNYAVSSAVNNLMEIIKHLRLELGFWRFFKMERVIIDGHFSKMWLAKFKDSMGIPVECLVNGDQKVYEISAASIIAKVYVDILFQGIGYFYPGYNIEKCHGSPNKAMYEKLRKSGPNPFFRTNYGRGWWEKIMKGERRDR